MKHVRALAILLVSLAAPLYPPNVQADPEVSFEYFQEVLSPFGEWIEVSGYGLCWRPTGVAADWAPYTDGYWAYTDAGWTWVSYEDWGGITYHYGRWVHLVDEGWVWVPEYDWGPAWVSWRSNDDYVGWAPLPPEAHWVEDTGFSTWVDTSYDIGPDYYRFCHTRDFGAPFLAPVLLPCERNVTFIQSTVNITNICFNRNNSRVFCGGPNFNRINRHLHRPIPSLKLHCEDREVRGSHGQRAPQVVRGNQIAVYAPKVKRPADLKALPISPRRQIGADKINRGWSRVPDLAAQEQVKQHLLRQNKGLNPRTAPARPVKAADLIGVPTKADTNAPSPNAIVRDRNGPARNPVRPALPSVSEQPHRPVAETKPIPQNANPEVTPPAITERVESPQNRTGDVARPPGRTPPGNPSAPVSIQPPQSRPHPSVPAQSASGDEGARAAEVERSRAQKQQQQQQQQAVENAQRAESARQQAESAQRASELRNRQIQQQQQNEQRAAEVRNERLQSQRQQAEAASRQQEVAERGNEIRRQPAAQQHADFARQQQQQAAQRAMEMRNQQAQQAAVARQREDTGQRSNEMRQAPQVRQAPPPQREHVTPPSRPDPPQISRPAPAQSKDGDDGKRRERSGR